MTADPSFNYSGRTVDYLIFQGVEPSGEVKVDMALGDSGSVCTGVQKAAQTFTLLFLTDKGSVLDEPLRGTNFLKSLRNGTVRDEATFEAQFRFAVMDALNYDAKHRSADTPDDERLEAAELLSYDLQPGSVTMYVSVTTVAGDSRTIIMPVETPIK
jgi:hypothetical protein